MARLMTCTLAATGLVLTLTALSYAQQADLMVVFDGSGSMWGQIDGRTKIEIARDTLSSVLSEAAADQNIGMIAYGHRKKGVCSDIETLVPVGPASRTVPDMIALANQIKPKGKTPLSDAVRMAAEELKFTENAATVVLVTDGIETCNADPCALAAELESSGINFTAHVVGFGLSQEEGRQVQCLADQTGGLYLSANNADQLSDALKQTLNAEPIAPSADDFVDDGPLPRNVQFIFRDVEAGQFLDRRNAQISFESNDGLAPEEGSFNTHFKEVTPYTASGAFPPGRYTALINRLGDGGYLARYDFEVLTGEGVQVIDASLGGSLNVNVFVNPNEPYDYAAKPPSAVKNPAWVYLALFPVVDGTPAEKPLIRQNGSKFDEAVPPGQYLLRGTIDRTTTVEKLIEVSAGSPTLVDFSFDVTRVYIDARQNNGAPVKRQTTYWYDKVPSGRNYWRGGSGGIGSNNALEPFYLPTGQWVVGTGGEGYGKRRSQRLVEVPGDYSEIRLEIGEGETLSAADTDYLNSGNYRGCAAYIGVGHTGCLANNAQANNDEAAIPTVDPVANQVAPSFVFETGAEGAGTLSIFETPAQGDQLTFSLGDNWCGNGQCAADSIEIERASASALFTDGFSTSSVSTGNYEVTINSFGPKKVIFVTGSGGDQVRFEIRG